MADDANDAYQRLNRDEIRNQILDDSEHQVSATQELPEENAQGLWKAMLSFNSRQKKFFFSLCLLSITDAVGFTSITPFFSIVAEKKGLNELQIGMIFSAYSLAGIFSALIVGSVVGKVGAKFCVVAGMFWSAGSTLCFGILYNTSKSNFLILSVACRMLMGFGMNASYTAMFALVFQEFGVRSMTVMGLSESLVAIGGMVGPLLGGGLYSAGGYMLPFIVLSVVQALLTLLCYVYLPSQRVEKQAASVPPVYLLLSFSGLLCFLVVVSIFTMNAYIIAFLPNFLNKQFYMEPLGISILSLVGALCYSLFTYGWATLNEIRPKWPILEVGMIGMAVGCVLMGPWSLLQELFGWNQQHKWLVYLAYCIIGVFFGASLVQTFTLSENAFADLKLKDSEITKYGLLSGMWNIAFSVGDVLGPTAGGLIIAKIKFPDSVAIFGAILLFLTVLSLLLRLVRHRRKSSSSAQVDEYKTEADENAPLLVNV